jgi:hypothetical protein
MLPYRDPAVITARRVPRDPCPKRHRTDVSDSHSVPSHPVCPDRTIAVKATTPNPAPCTVIDADPVPCLLYPLVTLTLPVSIEYAEVPLPNRSPAVITTHRVPRAPSPTRHRTDVSDSHPVPSHPVCPDRTIAVKATAPNPAPCTDTDADPVPALLYPLVTLTIPVSIEYTAVLLPSRSPAVITTRRVPRAPCPALHRTDVSDLHSVPSHPVSPDRIIAVRATSPMLAPCTVTDADPVPARFPRYNMPLTEPRSAEYAAVILPGRSPAEITTRRVPQAPCAALHLIDVSDPHSVPSHPVCPDRTIAVKAACPRLDPCTVTGADPVPALFARRIALTEPTSTDHPSLMLPDRSPAVITTRRVPRAPCPTLHRTDVSDSHSVPSHPVCPDRTIAVKATTPKPAPCTVTEAEPVPALLYPLVTLTLPASIEYTAVPLPDRSPAVITIRRVPRIPCPILHRTDVSDSHSVPSHPVCPERTIAVKATSPNSAPSIVTDVDPVPALLYPLITLTLPVSIEYIAVPLPDRSPAVITTRRVPRAPCPVLQRTDVSDSHSDPSHPVCPDRTITVKATSPRLDP